MNDAKPVLQALELLLLEMLALTPAKAGKAPEILTGPAQPQTEETPDARGTRRGLWRETDGAGS